MHMSNKSIYKEVDALILSNDFSCIEAMKSYIINTFTCETDLKLKRQISLKFPKIKKFLRRMLKSESGTYII